MAGTGRQGEKPARIDPGPVVPEAVVFMAWMGSGFTCCFYRGTIACCNQLLLYCSLLCSGSHLGFYCSDIQIRASIQTLQNGVPHCLIQKSWWEGIIAKHQEGCFESCVAVCMTDKWSLKSMPSHGAAVWDGSDDIYIHFDVLLQDASYFSFLSQL